MHSVRFPSFSNLGQHLVESRASARSSDPSVWYPTAKRFIELTIIFLALPGVLVVVAVAALAIWLYDPGPIFFVQERVGLHGRVFRMFKLRTMKCNKQFVSCSATDVNDPRVTGVGFCLRITHLDELPQLLNVLLGDMSLIGPRPEQVKLVDVYRRLIPDYDLRHEVRPGLTGLAQVQFGYAADVEQTRAKLAYDLFYVQNHGPVLDLRIALSTCLVYLNRRYVR